MEVHSALGGECHVGLDSLAAPDWNRYGIVGVDRVGIEDNGVRDIESGVYRAWFGAIELRPQTVQPRGIPGLSRYAEEIVAWADVGYLIHTAVVGHDRLPLLCSPNPIKVSILIEAHLRSADGLASFIAHRAIEDRLGREIKNQVFGF